MSPLPTSVQALTERRLSTTIDTCLICVANGAGVSSLAIRDLSPDLSLCSRSVAQDDISVGLRKHTDADYERLRLVFLNYMPAFKNLMLADLNTMLVIKNLMLAVRNLMLVDLNNMLVVKNLMPAVLNTMPVVKNLLPAVLNKRVFFLQNGLL